MAGSAQITVSGLSDSLFSALTHGATNQTQALLALAKLLRGIALGAGDQGASRVTLNVSTVNAARAAGTLTISSGSGSIACVVNGTSVAVTWATSDANTAGLLATAINADATVNKLVSAVAVAGTVVVTAHAPGLAASATTFTCSGTGATITGSGKLGGTTTGAGANAAPTVYAL